MKIKILMVGKNKDCAIDDAIAEFERKINPFCKIELLYLKDERVTNNPKQALEKEAKTIERNLNDKDMVIALDERGKMFSTLEFTKSFSKFQHSGIKTVTFIIGSAYGLSQNIKAEANLLFSLSPLTMSHQVARLVLLEQLYRIFTILAGMPYHKEYV